MPTHAGVRLVGRASELLAIEKVISSALAGSPGAVALVGEPGIGKTSMADELRRRAADAGFEIFSGIVSEFEREIPFGLVVDALDEPFRGLKAEIGRDRSRSAELAAVLPSLGGSRAQPSGAFEVERFKFHRAVRDVLARLAAHRPLLLVLDDLQWADPASVETVAHLIRRAVPGMILALAYRPQQIPTILATAIEQAVRDGTLAELALTPLTISEAGQLLSKPSDSPALRDLYAESGGNPFYLEQLARVSEPDRHTVVGPVPTKDADIPESVRAVLAQELAVLPQPALEVLQAAAIAGDPFATDLVAEIVGLDHPATAELLDVATAADLVRVSNTPGRLCFRHPIVRRVVYEGTLPGWRLAAHRSAARVLARHGASSSVRAHHVERSAVPGDEEAIAVLTHAGWEAAARAPATAASWFNSALRLLPESKTGQRLQLTVALAGALASAGRLLDCRAALNEALELLSSDSLTEQVPIIGMIARADHGLGQGEQAKGLITAALAQAEVGSADEVALRLDLAENHFLLGQWQDAVETAQIALAQAEALGDEEAVLKATSNLAYFTSSHGSVAEAQRLVDAAAAGMDALDANASVPVLDCLGNLVFTELSIDRFQAAARHSERGLLVSRLTGHGFSYCRFTFGETAAKLMLGQLAEARAAAENSLEVSLMLENHQLLAVAWGFRCWVETMSGDLAAALIAGREAVRAAELVHDDWGVWLARACYGEALIEAGQPERGRQEILILGGSSLVDMQPTVRPFWQQALVSAELSAGRFEVAEKLALEMAESASDLHSRRGHARYAMARVLFQKEQFAAAAALAQEASRCFDAVEMQVYAARARLIAGRSLAGAGRAAEAVGELLRAHEVVERVGASRLRDEVAKELRLLGKRVRGGRASDSSRDLPILTEREQEIARLVAQGRTNREIAADLFISPRTIEKHMARIFAKLGVSSRAALAGALNVDELNSR